MEDGSKVDKEALNKQFQLLRDAPTEDLYVERRERLFDLSLGVLVCPSKNKNSVSFREYFDKNWESCRTMWVFAYRKHLP